jgi:ADP-heptose:LPS heptosyltransferase
MIAFCLTGGIGDAILSVPIVRKIKEIFQQGVVVLYFDNRSTPIVKKMGAYDCRLIEKDTMSAHEVYGKIEDCEMAIWNTFKIDNDGQCNFFHALHDRCIPIVRERRELYLKNLSSMYGKEIKNMREHLLSGLMEFLCNEHDYYADMKRFGIDVGYDDVNLEIPFDVVVRNKFVVDRLGEYSIVHDSRLSDEKNTMGFFKSWYVDRWESVCQQLGGNIVHMKSSGQKTFSGCVQHEDVIGGGATFFDYLYLLSRCKYYIGTCSWPSIAAIFLTGPKFTILRGPTIRRWDFGEKYSTVIRRESCQACQYINYECRFKDGKRMCMESITVDDVIKSLENKMSSTVNYSRLK